MDDFQLQIQQPSIEEIARTYTVAFDSVLVINTILAKATKSQEDINTLQNNAGHLLQLLEKTYWIAEDLMPLEGATIAAMTWLSLGIAPVQDVPLPPSPEQIIAQLWQAAHDYEYAQVSGSAIGLLAIGVMQNLPKCVAVQSWIKSIWTLYYTRKALLTPDYDFSSVGVCPHSVPELMTELGL